MRLNTVPVMALFEAGDAAAIAESLEDPEAFAVVFDMHHGPVFRYAARRIGPEAAADVTSEVFAKAFQARSKYDPSHGDVLPWLYGIAANTLGDRLGKVERDHRVYLHLPPDLPHNFEDDAIDRLDAATASDRLNSALGILAEIDREALLLFALEQLSYSEIGTALGIPTGTVASRINPARRIVREAEPRFVQITGWEHKPTLGRRTHDKGPEPKGQA